MIAAFPDLRLSGLPFSSASALGRLQMSLLLGCFPRRQPFRAAAGALLACDPTANTALMDMEFAHVHLLNNLLFAWAPFSAEVGILPDGLMIFDYPHSLDRKSVV